ncbi:MAG: hypothetical protein J6P58_05345 [Oscillospiraceae bacterium]|nr:hypothetical protein [Oscillospiraceae bacterium]
MRSKLRKSDFEEIYRLLDSVSPLDFDCGTLCGAACCTRGDDPEMGIYLLPGEEKMFERREEWFEWSTERAEDYDFPESWKGAVHFIRCKNPPVCPRERRPIQCRSYPLLPHISEDGELSLVYNDFETPYSCPLIEDEILLNGELKDGVYINRYFGIKLSVPEGWTLTRLNDDATESTEMIPMRQVYEEEMNGLFFTASSDSFKGYIDVYITALKDGERGLNEEELIRKNIEDMWEINRLFGDDEGPEYATAMLVGEEHPVSVSVSESEAGEQLFAVFAIPKGDFKYEISISAANARLEDLTGFFEKI